MHRRTLIGAAALLATTCLPVVAMADYPERDIRVVVPWGAGDERQTGWLHAGRADL